MAKIQELLVANPIVNARGEMTEVFQDWVLTITNQADITGNGSPEGVVEALQFSTYKDKDATTPGTIVYSKQLAQIGGDPSKGWVLT